MRRRVEVRCDGKTEADECHEGGDGVDDENRRESMSLSGTEREVGTAFTSKQLLCI